MIDKIFTWILVSSADPAKWSLAVKSSIIFAIPTILYALGVTCTLGLFCVSTDANALEAFATIVGNVILGALTLVSGVIAAYGWIRKFWRTMEGKNQAIDSMQ